MTTFDSNGMDVWSNWHKVVEMPDEDLKRCSELRALIEGFAARHAALRVGADPSCGHGLGTILADLRRAVLRRDYTSFRAADMALHESVAIAAGVPGLVEAWRAIWSRLEELHRQGFEQCFPDARSLIDEHTHLIETVMRGEPAAAEEAARLHVEAVWFRLAESMDGEARSSDPVERAVAHLAFRLNLALPLREVARKVAFTSSGNLSRLIRKRYGVGYRAYLQRLRIDKAAELLRTTGLSVGMIARRVGYADVSRFCEHFKRTYGMKPMLWRRRGRDVSRAR